MDHDWGGGYSLIEHEILQSLINLFPKKLLAGEGGVKENLRTYHFSVTFELMYRNLLNCSVIFS
jgi:hypothetical protein